MYTLMYIVGDSKTMLAVDFCKFHSPTVTDAYVENTSAMSPVLLKAWRAQKITSKGAFVKALLDAVGSAHVERLGYLLVHETLPVENIGHHHPQVKHLEELSDGGHLHQVSSTFIQAASVQVLQHGLEREQRVK